MALQEILACAVGEDVIRNASNVVDFVDDGIKVVKLLKKYLILKTLIFNKQVKTEQIENI
jgi:hypothetical protein